MLGQLKARVVVFCFVFVCQISEETARFPLKSFCPKKTISISIIRLNLISVTRTITSATESSISWHAEKDLKIHVTSLGLNQR